LILEVESSSFPGMESPTFARAFTDLVVYQRARTLAREVFTLTKRLPREEAYSLTDQWRRAARSVGAQIAEAWAKRRFPKHFASKLTDADGENLEIQHWTIVAFDDGYLAREEAQRFGMLSKEVGKMLGEMIQDAASFCGDEHSSVIKEAPAVYFAPSSEEDPLNTEY
jgi:four helix bundle protein